MGSAGSVRGCVVENVREVVRDGELEEGQRW